MANLKLSPGVITGNALKELFAYCKEVDCALPAVNVIGSNTANAAMAAAKEAKAPIIVQLSQTGSQFYAGKTLDNSQQQASIAGSISGALHVRTLAKVYGVPVILHTDHCAKKLLPWVDGVIAAGEEYFARNGEPLFSSHMLDLSEQPLAENIEISKRTLTRIAKMNMTLEIELGITGGEEDGVDNSDTDHSKLYTSPEDVLQAYDALNPVGSFTVAASFGNTHGVYAPGNVKLKPTILRDSQQRVQEQRKTGPEPVSFVFHGGSGFARGDPRGGLLRRGEDEHRHRHAVGVHPADQAVHGRKERVSDAAARQPRGARQAEQEVHRPARLGPRRREGHDRPPGPGLQRAGRLRQVRVLGRPPRAGAIHGLCDGEHL